MRFDVPVAPAEFGAALRVDRLVVGGADQGRLVRQGRRQLLVDGIAKRDGVSRLRAMELATDHYPEQFRAYQNA